MRELGQPEVDQLRLLAALEIGGEDHVRRLDVAVDHAGRVRRLERPAEPRARCEPRARVEPLLALEHLVERRAAHVLHHQERRIADHQVEEARHVAVLDRGDRLGLLLKALAEARVGEQLGLEHLDRDLAPDRQVLGDEHLAHRAVAERLDQLVPAGDHVADRELAALQELDELVGQGVHA